MGHDRPLGELELVTGARTLAEVIGSVRSIFGPDSQLFAIDHAFENLSLVDGSEEGLSQVRIAPDLRRALLESRSFDDEDAMWIPLPERMQTVFVVRSPSASELAPETGQLIGSVMRDHRTRFEDLERQRRRDDMSVAADLQWDLLPLRADALGGFDIASVLEPAYEAAGDVFDYAMSDRSIWLYSFDGMGHGMDATVTSVLTLAAVRNARRKGAGLAAQMTTANDVLFERFGGDRFVTGVACCIAEDGAVSIVNAGHEPVRLHTTAGVSRLDLRADLPLGVDGDPGYRVQNAPSLSPGDGIALFSDGSAESTAPDGSSFGADGVDESLAENWTETPLRTGHGIVDRVMGFIDGGDVADDITVVVARRRITR